MSERKKPRKAAGSNPKPKPRAKPANAATQSLSMQQERFVHEYLAETPPNATAAYKRAGYRASDQAARTAAARLLRQPAIQAAIAAVRARSAAKFEVTRERVLEEYAKIAFADPRKFFNDDGSLKHPADLDDGTAGALSQFEIEEEYIHGEADQELEGQPHGGALKREKGKLIGTARTAKIKWSDKKAALDSIVKMMGYAKDQDPLGSIANPLNMIVQDMQGRRSALIPVATDTDDAE